MLGSENAMGTIYWAQYSREVTQRGSKRRIKTQDAARTQEQAKETPKGVLTVLMMWQYFPGEKLVVVDYNGCLKARTRSHHQVDRWLVSGAGRRLWEMQ